MKKLIIFLFISFLLLIYMSPTLAQEKAVTPVEKEKNLQDDQNEIQEKVKEKIEQVQKKPKAYIGTVTDIGKETLQIKNKSDEIQLISLNENETSFVQINDTTKNATFDDLAIGDFTVSMGFINDTDVLDAKRILITSPVKEPERKIVFGTVKDLAKKQITITQKENEGVVINFPKKWKGPEINELEEGMEIVAVYQPENNVLTIRTIEIVSSEPSPTPEDS